jgi:thiamine transport system permease protein
MTGIPRWPGHVAAAIVLALCLGTLIPLALRADQGFTLAPSDLAAIRFTLTQALLSAAISVLLAIPVARALARRHFPDRSLLITLLGAPFILPVIVAVLGLLAIFGRSGVLNTALAALGLPTVSIYGLQGVVLAHVFFNLPLATRFLLMGWLSIPAEHFRLAASLNLPTGPILERPMLRRAVPPAFVAIFLLCLTSFAVALTLGGGPAATTVELAIYQSLRFDFDPGRAALLSLVQFALCTAAAMAAAFLAPLPVSTPGLDRHIDHFDSGTLSRLTDTAALTFAALFLLLPLAAVILRGAPALLSLPPEVWSAAARSITMALASTALCLALTLALCLAPGPAATLAASVPLATSALALGTGLFLILYRFANPVALAMPITVIVNAVLSLPFALRATAPALSQIESTYGRLATSLGLTGMARLRVMILPRLRRPLGFAAGLAAALSMGDLGVIALFADADQATLPLVMHRLMGAYRMDDAAGAALLLLALSLALFRLFDRGARSDADA